MIGNEAHAVITSPPYLEQRDYDGARNDVPWCDLVAGALLPASESAQILVNLGLIHRNHEVVCYWNDLIDAMRAENWRLAGWYVWDKLNGMPGDWASNLAPSHEWIFHFNRHTRRPNKTVPTKYSGHHAGNAALRKKNGRVYRRHTREGWRVGHLKISDSVLRIHPEKGSEYRKHHPAVFPVALPLSLISSYTDPGDVVIDPFMGIGTTAIAAMKLGRRFIGVEKSRKYFKLAVERVRAEAAQPDMFVERCVPSQHNTGGAQ